MDWRQDISELQGGSIGILGEIWHYTVGTGTQPPVATSCYLFTSVATVILYVASLNINFTLLCRHNFFNMAEHIL